MNLNCIILHVEDDDNDSFFFQRALGAVFFVGSYRRVPDVKAAMLYLAGDAHYSDRHLFPLPNVLVVDSSPHQTGKSVNDLLAWLKPRDEFKNLVKVALTGGTDPKAREALLSQGVAGVLSKGASFPEFALAVADILGRYAIPDAGE
ncbi:MAG TPA: hypothetical protein VNT99_06875 [Methylomirabilota bacterium]|nr:hypothetical protein [Methylomirabilota bacterium]